MNITEYFTHKSELENQLLQLIDLARFKMIIVNVAEACYEFDREKFIKSVLDYNIISESIANRLILHFKFEDSTFVSPAVGFSSKVVLNSEILDFQTNKVINKYVAMQDDIYYYSILWDEATSLLSKFIHDNYSEEITVPSTHLENERFYKFLKLYFEKLGADSNICTLLFKGFLKKISATLIVDELNKNIDYEILLKYLFIVEEILNEISSAILIKESESDFVEY